MRNRDSQLDHIERAFTDDIAWLAQQLADIHELAYGPASSSSEVIIQSHNTHDISSLVGTHAQDIWRQIADLADRIIAIREHASRLFSGGHPEWRPRQRDMDRTQRRTLEQAQDRRRDRGEYVPVRIVHANTESPRMGDRPACKNPGCNSPAVNAGRCEACRHYWRRHHTERPAYLVERNWRRHIDREIHRRP
jgi:hypothetical protein